MPKDINVLVIEDDPYARDLMVMLLTRDWRTRISAELGSEDDLRAFLRDSPDRIGAVLIDTEVPGEPNWVFRMANHALESAEPPAIICTANRPNLDIFKRLVKGGFSGYLLKSELGYSVATAIAKATKTNRWLVTPGTYRFALQHRIELPRPTAVIDGTKPVIQLTEREAEVARLAILFNHPHRELSDELLIRADQVSKHVSSTYQKLGLDEILNGEIDPSTFFSDQLILNRFQEILERVMATKSRRKTADMATLAFHLLTVPDYRDLL
jgi:DNA-binding NarL/FixJ family response regulator